jgi:DNA-binding MarR family transcriptional regulator
MTETATTRTYAGAGTGQLLGRIARATGAELRRELEGEGLSRREFAVLDRLAATGPVAQQRIGQDLHIHASNLVAVLEQLETRGLVVRPRDPDDRRRYLLELSPAGERLLEQAAATAAEIERELLTPLDAEERRQLKALLERLADHSCCAPGDRSCRR